MSPKSAELIPAAALPLIPIGATVQMDDVVSIRVAGVERSLHEMFESKKMELEALRKELETTMKARDKQLAREGEVVPAEIKALQAALKAAGSDAKVKTGNPSISGGKILLPASIKSDKNYQEVGWQVKLEMSETLRDAEKAVAACQKKVNGVSEEMSKLVQARGKLGSVERSARAAVASQRLSQTTEGKKILAELEAHDPSLMLGLPPGTIKS